MARTARMISGKRTYRKGYCIRRRSNSPTIGLGYRVRVPTKKKIEDLAIQHNISQAEVIELLVERSDEALKAEEETRETVVKKQHGLDSVITATINGADLTESYYLMVPVKKEDISDSMGRKILES